MSDANVETETPVCYRHPNRPTWVSCQRCGRYICPECQTQAAVGVQCPECVREGRAGMPGRAPAVVRALRPSGTPVVTYTLIGLCVLAYIAQFLTGQALTAAWFLDPSRIESEPWRVITSAFLHSPGLILHLLFNMYALFAFGPALEVFLGRARFLALYLIGALGGSVAVVAVYQLVIATNGGITQATGGFIHPISALGASGAIFALMGGLFALRKAMGINMQQLVIVLVINLALGFFVPNVAWQAHVGGLVVGFVLGQIFSRTRRPQDRARQVGGVAATAAALVVLLVAFVLSAPTQYYF
ncbi:MAG TPA: rhomboid family intramembrane serine protease [Pseudolysinimonas sp.]